MLLEVVVGTEAGVVEVCVAAVVVEDFVQNSSDFEQIFSKKETSLDSYLHGRFGGSHN